MLDLSHILLLETEHKIGAHTMPEVILFNINHVSQDEAYEIAKSGVYSDDILYIPRSQWIQLFCNGDEM